MQKASDNLWCFYTLYFLSLAMSAALCQREKNKISFVKIETSSARMLSDLNVVASKSHPFGSLAQAEVARYLLSKLDVASGKVEVFEQIFKAKIPNQDYFISNLPSSSTVPVDGKNIYAIHNDFKERDCLVLIGSHYDSKFLGSEKSLGANDSGSSSVVLLELMRVLSDLEPQQKRKLNVSRPLFGLMVRRPFCQVGTIGGSIRSYLRIIRMAVATRQSS